MGIQFMLLWALIAGLICFGVYRASIEPEDFEIQGEEEEPTTSEYWRCLSTGGC